ncbi:DUF3237 domain-containing protein [Rhodococcus maanshanensis]|uniref:UPF0311 protein SAMN05444583_105113 n=1 Tax=Rhodococcus maanshanensis TaxID=183556 RepID=A0A1H7LQ05_9NOCA|nr:DUF3237 domain-containing protein [Rhodococcus maanshanensis]SEL00808.1 Protein of unknown function [Rhodococcus maanshanensis]
MTRDSRVKDIDEIKTTHLFDMVVDLNPPLNVGKGPFGHRTIFTAAGGSFDGPRLRGEVLTGGGDWGLYRPDGGLALDVRLTLRTDDGAHLHVTYGGRWIVPADLRADIVDPTKRTGIDPAQYYFRTAPLFETGATQYAWLNDIVCIGSGYPVEGGVAYRVSQVL